LKFVKTFFEEIGETFAHELIPDWKRVEIGDAIQTFGFGPFKNPTINGLPSFNLQIHPE